MYLEYFKIITSLLIILNLIVNILLLLI